jgi:hypothetical protein
MSLQEKPERFKQFFLLAFTRELIKNYSSEAIIKIEAKEELKKEEIKEKAKEAVKEFEKPLKLSPVKQLKAITEPTFKPLPKPFVARPRRRLMIPKPNLPQRLQYIQPVPTTAQLDLGKLNPLIQDPNVQAVECNGPDQKIIVMSPGERTTEVTLTKEEIDQIINNFSQASKIPVTEGILRIAYGRLLLSAIVSGVVGSKFVIKKMRLPPPMTPGAPIMGQRRLY